MMEAKFPDGHSEKAGPGRLKDMLQEAGMAIGRGADRAMVFTLHVFVGQGHRCRQCGKIAGDVIHG